MEMKDQVSLQGKEEGDGFIKRASIGGESLLSPSTSSEEEEESEGGEVEKAKSQVKNGVFGCLGSLEDSLPIKRGLSSFFSGKSKSFSSLSDMGNMSSNNLVKTENSFNKRRRVRMASKAKRASYTLLISLPLPPPPPLLKDHISEEGDKEGIQEQCKKETNTI